ncbi:hypothetical protein ERO13_A08G016400v2 [Gossypium hirsutum]|uniref:Integrase catalytic domain-containing protein n=2 Tax=Gossypium TaxID=3633 RepID=A0A1U8LD61_GOSHI|nr:uncharacterized protein LOC107926236 [Gossypium hirsutum]KAG4186019.1 hypothetical protein ERO13_A08G016400v2 [Gossypium hirsutum]KAG4186020.1 hypothetical protein ERO13_A08G016400v2 [Gossypium hirsutum]TYI12919.1 hypothetical protein ES332_A08G022400v1 [Gossypium tomentosum]
MLFVESGIEINFLSRSNRTNPTSYTETFNRTFVEQVFPRFHTVLAPTTVADPLNLRYCRLLKAGKKLRETRQTVIFILEVGSPRQITKSSCSYKDKGMHRICSTSCSEKGSKRLPK